MTADLVPADNMTALEALDPQARELAVTNMLTEARAWLAHAVEATEPRTIAEFKAQMATVAEVTKQLNLSKEIQLDATEMVRRAERGVGVAIRKGQADGMIRRAGSESFTGNQHVRGVVDVSDNTKPSPYQYASRSELTNSSGSIYDMTDDVTDEEFEQGITEAKAEGNLSRANVVRKLRGEPAPKPSRPEMLRGIRRKYDLPRGEQAA